VTGTEATPGKGAVLGAVTAEPYPLSRGYTRESAVLVDIADLERLPAESFWQRAAMRDYQQAGCPRLETLVYLVRSRARAGRTEDAWRIIDVLTRRVTPTIQNRFARVYGISRDQAEDLYEEVIAELYEAWLSEAPSDEFWEVRFGVCLDRKVIDAIKRYRRIRENEIALATVSDDGSPMDPLEQMPDPAALDPETAAAVNAALDSLPEPLRTAFYMTEIAGFTEEATASHLGVTSRTIRNYLARARKHLAPWREG
jgi:RNA polymerase sigma factor (sigma-70 family)